MNHQAILIQLREAKEELDRTIEKIANDPSFDFERFQVAMNHVYHHLNTAWNGRDASSERHRKCSQKDFDTWRKFPKASDFSL